MDWKKLYLDPLPDEHIKGTVSMLYTCYHYDKLLANTLKPFGISYEQFSILKILEDIYPKTYTLKNVQIRLINQTANTTRLVEKLRLKELLKTERDDNNRRLMNINITKKGIKLLSGIHEPFEAIRNELNSAMTIAEAETLTRLLEKIQTVCKK